MKILLVSLNSQYMHVSPAPYCLKAGIKAFSVLPHSVTVYSGNVNEDPAKILEAVERESPDLIGFCCYIWNVTLLKALLPAVKEKAPSAFLVFGGPEASFAAEELLVGCRELSAVLCGEGEKNFALLADVLEQKRSLSTVPGLCFRKPDGGFFLSAYEGEGTPPTPDREYVDAVFRKISYLESSRGCPFTCAFCLSGRCGKLRFFDLDRVFPAVDALAHSGSKIIKFVDRTFNADKKRAVVVWKYLLSKYGNDYPTDICFHFELAGELLDEECFSVLQSVPRGYFQLEIGLQSFCPETLRAIHRSPDNRRLSANIARLISFGNMHIHIDLIAGLPYETYTLFSESFRQAYALKANMLQLGFLKLLHGAEMRENPSAFPCVYAKEPPYEIQSNPWITREELLLLKQAETGCDRLYNSGKWKYTLSFLQPVIRKDPLMFFRNAGEVLNRLRGEKGLTLNGETEALFGFFSSFVPDDREILRDKMLTDIVLTNSSCFIPEVLRREDPLFPRRKREAEKKYPPSAPSAKRQIVYLPTEKKILIAEYSAKDSLENVYPHRFIPEKPEE